MTSSGFFNPEQVERQVEYWFDLCEYDIETAKVMLVSGRLLYVGFMCHQVVEKGLKAAFVASQKTFPPRLHALVALAQRAGLYGNMSEEQRRLLDTLEPLNIECRYPAQKDLLLASLTQARCQELIIETGDMLAWIKIQLSKK